jgi:lysophospholipase L1-like esterase
VTGLEGYPVATTTPTSTQVLTYNGSAWAPANIPVTLPSGVTSNGSNGLTISGNLAVGATVLNPLPGYVYSANVSASNQNAILFGDSITDLNGGAASYPTSPFSHGYFDWANALLGQPLTLVKNAGIGGNTTIQMLARISTDVYPYCSNAGWIFIMGGVNDIPNSPSETAASIEANLKAIYQGIRSNCGGINIVALTVTARTTFTTTAFQQEWSEVNRWIQDYGRSQPHFFVVDTAATSVDPLNATGPVPIAGWASDDVHPTPYGAFLMGSAIAASIRSYVSAPALLPSWSGDPTNTITNGFMTGTAGTLGSGATGTVPTGWTASCGSGVTGVWGVSSRADGFGKQVTITITGTNNLSVCSMTRNITPGATGEKWIFTEELLSSSNPTFQNSVYCSTCTPTVFYGLQDDSTYGSLTASPFSAIVRSYPFIIPTGGSVAITVGMRGASGSLVIGRVALQRLSGQ